MPTTLYHSTPTRALESILRLGLIPQESFMHHDMNERVVNLSTKDETDLVVFFGDANGVIGDYGKPTDTVTLLEVNVSGLMLEWPGQDGPHHYVAHDLIAANRIRVVSTCTLDEVAEMYADD